MSMRSFYFNGGEIFQTWLGESMRVSRWLEAPAMIKYDQTLTDDQRKQLADVIIEYDKHEAI